MLKNCVVGKEVGIKASPSAAGARGTGRDGLGESHKQQGSPIELNKKASMCIAFD